MAQSGLGNILMWGAIGVGAWWIYESYFAGTGGAASGGNAGSGGAGAGGGSSAGSSGGTSGGTDSGTSNPPYSGPSLATIFANFQAAVAANYPPPAAATIPPPIMQQGTIVPGRVRTVAPVTTGRGLRGLGDASISYSGGVYYANPDVFNYYLAQVLPSAPASSPFGWPPDVTEVFPGFDRSQLMSITDYWSGMSGYLSSMGLSGLGLFAGLGYIAAANRGWPEIAERPWNGGAWPSAQGWWNGGAGRAVQ